MPMIVADIQKVLIDHFKTLNEVSGIEFITSDNVAYPNESFVAPDNKRWFEVSFLPDAPETSAMFSDAQDRYSGILQIDICTPLDKGEDEASNKVRCISELFKRGQFLGDISVEITKVYQSITSSDIDHYRTVVRVNWTADIDI